MGIFERKPSKKIFMKNLYLIIPVFGLFLLNACDGDYRPMSVGGIDEVIVVMDSTQWESETAMAHRRDLW
jgi:hypothetical protein